MASTIVDPWGFPANGGSSGRLYEITRPSYRNRNPYQEKLNVSTHRLVGQYDWNTIVSASRNLVANFPILEGAITTKAMHSIGRAWNPVFDGQDKAWGEEAAAWLLNEFYQLASVRGENFDLKTSIYLASVALDTDGDFGLVLTETDGGYPKLQFLTADRIGQRTSEEIVKSGPFRGYRIQLGVIFDRYGAPAAYNILGATEKEDQQVEAKNFIFKFDPRFFDQGRGLPALRGSLLFIDQSRTSHIWEHQASMMASSIGLIEHNEAGGVDPNDPGSVMGTANQAGSFTSESFEGGMVRYFRAGTGSKLEQLKQERPGDSWEQFHDRTIRIAMGELGWPYSLTWKPDGMNGTQERSAIEQARISIADRQSLIEPMMQRICGYAVSKAIKLGILPKYTGKDAGGFLKWGFAMPPQFNIDHGREDQQARENYKLGFTTLGDWLAATNRGTVKDHWTRRAREQAMKQLAVEEVESEMGVELDPREIQMFNPNEMAAVEEVDVEPETKTPTE